MNLEEAHRVLEAAYPGQGVTVQTQKQGSFKIVKPNGEVLGAAFDLRKALQIACQPALEAEHKRRLENQQKKVQEIEAFMTFLRIKHDDEFQTWLKDQTPPSDAGRVEDDPPRLVSVVPG